MSLTGNRSSRLYLSLQRPKRHKWNDNQNCKSPSGSELHQLLSPDGLQSSSLALPNKDSVVPKNPSVRKIGNYLILQQIDTNLMSLASYKAVNIQTQQEYVCKVSWLHLRNYSSNRIVNLTYYLFINILVYNIKLPELLGATKTDMRNLCYVEKQYDHLIRRNYDQLIYQHFSLLNHFGPNPVGSRQGSFS